MAPPFVVDAVSPRSFSTERLYREPWRRVYQLAAWRRARVLVLARDGGRCTFVEAGVRCAVTERLHVHHTVKITALWARCPVFQEYVRAACDPSILVTVCQAHNNKLDARGRRAKPKRVEVSVGPAPNRFLSAIGRRAR